MNKIFTVLLLLSFLVQIKSQDSYAQDMTAKWQNVTDYTLEFAEAMPSDLFDYKPAPEEMSFAEQLIHICGNMVWLSGAYLGGKPFDLELSDVPQNKESVIETLKDCFAYTAETISKFDPKTLDEEVDFFAGPMSKRRVYFLLNDHVTHHRGQLVVYLRLNKIKPPSYVGW